ncbi:MAG: preprotein translocase subunit YajC [Bacteroidota bacterium]|nr:preprotein translocase subunit YajC [Bacteroidota bacterium]
MNILNLIAMTPQGGDAGGGIFSTIIMFALIIAIFYFLIIRPQHKRQKERQKLLDSVQKGDKVITLGGVHGVVEGVEDKTLLLKIADNVKVKIERSAISSIGGKGEAEAPKIG